MTGILLLEESHLSIHTWPEHAYAAVDFFTCGAGDPVRARDILYEALGAARMEALHVLRGQLGASATLSVKG